MHVVWRPPPRPCFALRATQVRPSATRFAGGRVKKGASRDKSLRDDAHSIVKQPDHACSACARHASSPLFFVRPGAAGRHARLAFTPFAPNQCLPSPVGACGTTGRFTAPAAPAWLDAGSPHAVFATAHEQWSSPTPKIVELNRATEADLRLRSARGWILRLAACPRGCRLRRRAPVRASCRPDMHLDRPPVAPASVPVRSPRIRDPQLRSRVRHRSGHPHPAPRFEDDRDAPLTGAGRDHDNHPRRQVENKCGTIRRKV